VAGLLVSPISWTHHWVWVLPAVAVGVRHRHDRPAYAVAGGVLVAPALLTSVLWAGGSPPVWSDDLYTVAALVWLAVLALVPPPRAKGDAEAHRAPSVSS
jgi:alpha-1,2-mannosyltransferase